MGIFKGDADRVLLANAEGGNGNGSLVMQELFTTTGSFTVTAAMDEVTFIGVGGGGAGATGFGGGGAGFFQKTFRVGSDVPAGTLFNLTIGAATGTTFLRDAGNTILCQATGGKNATASAHGTGGTASGGDINSNGAPGTLYTTGMAYGGAAGSPYGHSTGPDMYLISEYARAYVRQVKAAWLKSGVDIPKEPGAAFNDGVLGKAGDIAASSGGPGGFGGNGGRGGNEQPSTASAGKGGGGGFGGTGGTGGTSSGTYSPSGLGVAGADGGKGGFGGRGGTGGGFAGRGNNNGSGGVGGFGAAGGFGGMSGCGGAGGFGGGGGAGGAVTTISSIIGNGGPGGSGGYGGGGGSGFKVTAGYAGASGTGGPGGPGAILVLIKTRDDLAAVHM